MSELLAAHHHHHHHPHHQHHHHHIHHHCHQHQNHRIIIIIIINIIINIEWVVAKVSELLAGRIICASLCHNINSPPDKDLLVVLAFYVTMHLVWVILNTAGISRCFGTTLWIMVVKVKITECGDSLAQSGDFQVASATRGLQSTFPIFSQRTPQRHKSHKRLLPQYQCNRKQLIQLMQLMYFTQHTNPAILHDAADPPPHTSLLYRQGDKCHHHCHDQSPSHSSSFSEEQDDTVQQNNSAGMRPLCWLQKGTQ